MSSYRPEAPPNTTKTRTVFTIDNFSSTSKLAENIGSTNTINEKDELYNPFDERNVEHPNSDAGALLHLLKSSLGTGILAMPMAFTYGGFTFSIIGTLITGLICTHCVHILVKSSHDLCKRAKRPSLTFAETAEVAFEYGPLGVRKLASFARIFVNTALVLTYFGGNSVYVYFISKSTQEVVQYYKGEEKTFVLEVYMVLLLIVLIPLCQIRVLKWLVPFSGVANVLMFGAITITLYYLFKDGVNSPNERPSVGPITDWPLFFCTVIFAMEGIGVIMPVENSMRNPQHFLGCPGILNISMSIVLSLYTLMGIFGYLKYDTIKEPITSEIPIEEVPGQMARIFIAVAITFTYALQYFVPMDIIWSSMKQSIPKSYRNIAQISMRSLAVIATVVIAAVVNNLESLIGLVGAICFSILGLMVPCIVEIVTCWDAKAFGIGYWKLIKDIIILLFAMMTLISGSYSSIENLINPGDPETLANRYFVWT